MSATIPPIIHEWIDKAEADYRSAIALRRLRRQPLPDPVCFHAQQCAEKYLKALMLQHSLDPPRIHALVVLNNQLKNVLPSAARLDSDCTLLQQYAVDIRYPGDVATDAEARTAVEAMRRVRRFARRTLGLAR